MTVNERLLIAGGILIALYLSKQSNASTALTTSSTSTGTLVNCPGGPNCPTQVNCPGNPGCPGYSDTQTQVDNTDASTLYADNLYADI